MKTSARFLAVIIAVMMIVGAALTVSAFTDVEEGYEHAEAISTLTQLGVINGYADGTFKPDANVERDEMAKLVYVLYTTFADAGNGTVKFADVAADNWAVGYISWCSAKSIVGGYGDGSFKPDANISYDEALKMVCATLGYTDFDSNLWPTDVRQKALKELKLGTDIEANGSDKLTRGQVAQLLYNALFVDMNETKVGYVYDTSYVDGNGDPVKVKVPVEVAKTLAEDVWAFTSETIRVVGTENYGYNGAAKTSKDDTIRVEYADGTTDTVKLADLGLEAYEENTDGLIGLDIMTVTKDGKLVANASVLGTVKVAEVVFAGRDEADAVIVDEVKIDGVVYDDTKDSETLFANLKVLAYGAGTVNANDPFAINVTDDVADIEYPHMAIVMDNNGDGVVDAIAIDYYKLATVTKVEEVKATKTAEAYTKYTVSADLENGTGAFIVKSTDIAEGKTLAKGDVFVYATIDGVYFIDEVIAPVKEAVTKLTTGKNAAITLAETGAVKYIDGDSYFLASGYELAFDAAKLLKGDAEAQEYYIYNGVVVYATATAAEVADSYNLALLLYTKEVTEPVYNSETKKMETKWPATLLIDGKEVEVDVKTIDGQASTDAYLFADKDSDGTPDLNYTLVNYTVDEKTGKYIINTTASNLGDTVIVAEGAEIKLNPNTGLYTIKADGETAKVFELSDASAIYYTFNNEDDEDDKYLYFGTYTAANMLKKFEAKATAQEAYLLEQEDGTYILLATVVAGEFVAPVEAQTRTFKNDARLIKYVAEGSTAEAVDGVGYYTYLFLDFATMKNGSQTIDTTTSIEKGATKAVAGNFYGWDATAKKYVQVTTANTDAVKVGTITNVDAARGIIYINGVSYAIDSEVVDFAEGYKLPADVNIFSNSKNNVYEYATFDLAALAELIETAKENGKTIDAAVGTYFDEDGNLGFAWIIVDNYYWVTSGETEVFTQTSDIVGRIDAQ